jgi:hypothetical protein
MLQTTLCNNGLLIKNGAKNEAKNYITYDAPVTKNGALAIFHMLIRGRGYDH